MQIQFRVKSTTPMAKIMKGKLSSACFTLSTLYRLVIRDCMHAAYCHRLELDLEQTIFMFRDKRVTEEDTFGLVSKMEFEMHVFLIELR